MALIPGEVRIEVVGATAVTLDADAAPAPSTRRVGGVGRVFVLKTGTRGIELPGTPDGIRELGGSPAPARDTAFAPDAALSRAFPSGPGVEVHLGRPDTLLSLALRCPARARRGGAGHAPDPGVGSVDARLTIGSGAHLNGLGHAVAYPMSLGTHVEGATGGAVRVAGGCAVGDTIRVTVDGLVFPSRRLTSRSPVLLAVTVPAP